MVPKNKSHQISVVTTFCSNDRKYIQKCLDECKKFSSDIIAVYSDHFFDGSPEDMVFIQDIVRKNTEVTFIAMPYTKPLIPTFWDKWSLLARGIGQIFLYGSKYWICKARFWGFKKISKDTKYILFLDSDEIIEGRKFKIYLDSNVYKQYQALKLNTYYYFREPQYQATKYIDGPVMIRRKAVNEKNFWSRYERDALLHGIRNKIKRSVMGLNGKPMIHHYGWVRTKAEMLKKVATWSHNHHTNWKKLVEKEFSHEFLGKDFVQGYSYRKVRPFFTP